jgi:GNAT superfamily N-acetyltransferase
MKFHRITTVERADFQSKIAAIEATATYPLGGDFFQLDHGNDYFAFFDRLGEVNYYAALDANRVAAVGAGILRQIPDRQGESVHPAWYLCDLKVHPDYQRQHLSLRILSYAIKANIHRCDRGYAISMNSGDGSSNRLSRILERFSLVKFSCTVHLNIYSLDAVNMKNLAPLLIEHRGEISYLSLRGIKDLRLQSTGEMLPLLHVQWGSPSPKGNSTPLPGCTHMFCVPANDELATVLAAKEIYPNATASVISHGMDKCDWRFILTSDI